jgi:hypothetical protein
MPVEIALGFVLPGVCELLQVFWLAVSNTVGLGVKITLSPLGLLPGGPEIHNLSHHASRW